VVMVVVVVVVVVVTVVVVVMMMVVKVVVVVMIVISFAKHVEDREDLICTALLRKRKWLWCKLRPELLRE